MKNKLPLMRVCAIVTAAFWLGGCTSSPSARFYTLNPLGHQEANQPSPAGKPASVGIAPVEIPDYLDRPQIVTRDGRNVLKLAEFDRWAGSLSDNITAVLAENLAQLLGTDRIFVYPRLQAEKAEFSVMTRVLRLDCKPGEQVFLKVQWTLLSGPERKDVATQVASFTERLNDNRYETIAAAVSRTLEQLSREIARTISDRLKGAASSAVQQGSP